MLVPVPWQPEILVHADLLVKLEQVQARIGRPPFLSGRLSGWRSYDQQKALYNAYLAGKGALASNPDNPKAPNTHMRGVAADLSDTSRAMQAACRAVGLEREPSEAWHWQLPTWRSYPIIPERPKPPTPDQEEELMSASYLFAPASAGKPARYCIVGLDVPGGSYVTTNVQEAEVLGFVYGQQSGSRVGAPIKEITQAQLDTAVALYARERARKVAEEKGAAGTGAAHYTVQLSGTVQPK